MDNQNEMLDFKLKVFENNRKTIFEGCKQIEYKAYINLTLSAILLGASLNFIDKINYLDGKAKIIAIGGLLILLALNLGILFFSMLSLRTFDIKCYLSYEFFQLETIDNLSGLKDNLIHEITGKHKGLVKMYNTKDTDLDRSTRLLIIELSLIIGAIFSHLIRIMYMLLK